MSTTSITPIEIPFPAAAMPELRISAGACRLQIRAGTADPWVQGSYEDAGGGIPLHINQDLEGVRLAVGTDIADLFNLFQGVPQIELALGTAQPFALTIE